MPGAPAVSYRAVRFEVLADAKEGLVLPDGVVDLKDDQVLYTSVSQTC